jgi:hypothetical protein
LSLLSYVSTAFAYTRSSEYTLHDIEELSDELDSLDDESELEDSELLELLLFSELVELDEELSEELLWLDELDGDSLDEALLFEEDEEELDDRELSEL